MTGKRLLIDTSKCIACRACQVACKQWHSLPSEDTEFTGTYQNPPDMSGANLTVVKFTEVGNNGDLKWLFFKDQCRHCDPSPLPYCAGACPRGAIKKQANGIVLIDPAICDPNACSTDDPKPCQRACPYGIPKYKYERSGTVETVMRKCDFCYNRLTDPKLKGNYDPISPPYGGGDVKYKGSNKPACQLTCPPGAISSGKADKILKKAKRRRNYLRNHGYPNANIYPPQDGGIGPTHVIWVLTEAPSVYGL